MEQEIKHESIEEQNAVYSTPFSLESFLEWSTSGRLDSEVIINRYADFFNGVIKNKLSSRIRFCYLPAFAFNDHSYTVKSQVLDKVDDFIEIIKKHKNHTFFVYLIKSRDDGGSGLIVRYEKIPIERTFEDFDILEKLRCIYDLENQVLNKRRLDEPLYPISKERSQFTMLHQLKVNLTIGIDKSIREKIDKVNKLREDKFNATKDQKYEEAAKIRDMEKELLDEIKEYEKNQEYYGDDSCFNVNKNVLDFLAFRTKDEDEHIFDFETYFKLYEHMFNSGLIDDFLFAVKPNFKYKGHPYASHTRMFGSIKSIKEFMSDVVNKDHSKIAIYNIYSHEDDEVGKKYFVRLAIVRKD